MRIETTAKTLRDVLEGRRIVFIACLLLVPTARGGWRDFIPPQFRPSLRIVPAQRLTRLELLRNRLPVRGTELSQVTTANRYYVLEALNHNEPNVAVMLGPEDPTLADWLARGRFFTRDLDPPAAAQKLWGFTRSYLLFDPSLKETRNWLFALGAWRAKPRYMRLANRGIITVGEAIDSAYGDHLITATAFALQLRSLQRRTATEVAMRVSKVKNVVHWPAELPGPEFFEESPVTQAWIQLRLPDNSVYIFDRGSGITPMRTAPSLPFVMVRQGNGFSLQRQYLEEQNLPPRRPLYQDDLDPIIKSLKGH